MKLDYTKLKGVIHVGASTGQETEDSGIRLYDRYNLNVIWIEPIEEVYNVLNNSIQNYPKQKSFMQLVADEDDKNYDFYITNNNGESSSIFELKEHKKSWPTVHCVEKRNIKGKTLSTLLSENNIDLDDYDYMLLDTQGSELLVLKGAVDILKKIDYVNLEVADFDSYDGCCKLKEVEEFFTEIGYKRIELIPWNIHYSDGDYYTAIYERIK